MSRASNLAKAIGADGAIAVSGNTTLGDASTDTVTFNAATASIPNGINFANGNFGIGASSPWTKLSVYGTGNQFANLTSPSGSTTQVGVNLNPSMTAAEAAANPAQAAIYAVDNNYSANIIFANKATGAIGNTLTERMRVDASGNVGIGQSSLNSSRLWVLGPSTQMILGYAGGSTNYTDCDTQIWRNFAGTERMRIDSNGNLVFASGKGIDFSATSNASGMQTELLDDYEVGTWTPTWSGWGTAGTTTYSTQTGRYVKIGRFVMLKCYISGTCSGASSDYFSIGNFPFTLAQSGAEESGGIISYLTGVDMGAGGRGWWFYPASNTTRGLGGAFTQTGITGANPNVSFNAYITILYTTAS